MNDIIIWNRQNNKMITADDIFLFGQTFYV